VLLLYWITLTPVALGYTEEVGAATIADVASPAAGVMAAVTMLPVIWWTSGTAMVVGATKVSTTGCVHGTSTITSVMIS
jgi:hypothetical protein